MRCLVTGAAGFLGSHLTDLLLERGHEVIGVDNLSTGKVEFLSEALKNKKFQFRTLDLIHRGVLDRELEKVDHVFHLAAHADVSCGAQNPYRDIEQNLIVTHNVLTSMKASGVSSMSFTSTASVYGDHAPIPTPEAPPFPIQTSFYGTAKLASEGWLTSFSEAFGFNVQIFRLVSLLGERYTHGHVADFIERLKMDPQRLSIKGDGKQKKAYLYVKDAALGLIKLSLEDQQAKKIEIYNLASRECLTPLESAFEISKQMKCDPMIETEVSAKGWPGDVPQIDPDFLYASSKGWNPTVCVRQALEITIKDLLSR